MFDFAWSEIALVGGIALILIGPKDLPIAIKAITEVIKKARRMAGEFQTHVDEMVREANLHEVKDTFDDLRRMDIKGRILSAVDGDGALRKTMSDNPFDMKADTSAIGGFDPSPPPVPVADLPLPETQVAAHPEHSIPPPEMETGPPAFIPPGIAAAGIPVPPPPPPAFVPPPVVAQAAAARRAFAA